MTFAKLSKPHKFLFLLVLCFPCFAWAQQDSGYNPPPMFEDMTPLMLRPQTNTGNIIEPKSSPRIDAVPTQQKPRFAVPSNPVPVAKPQIPFQKPIIEPPSKPVAEPQTQSRQSKSAITGPISMPAIPAANVDRQVTYNGDEDSIHKNEPTIFERQQTAAKEKQKQAQRQSEKPLAPIVPRPKDTSTPSDFAKGEHGALKKIIPFEIGQISLSPDSTNSLAAGVVKELDEEGRKNWRVQIKSSATPYGDGISSDKRIALSRALSLRSSLIAQGIPAHKIDVLAQGLEAEAGNAGDKIDLYLYEPASE